MKKKKIIISIILPVIALIITSIIIVINRDDSKESTHGESLDAKKFSENQVLVDNALVCGNGMIKVSSYTAYYIDLLSMNEIPLCTKADCSHENNMECDAYYGTFGSSQFAYFYDEKLYVFGYNSDVFVCRAEADGTNRKVICSTEGKIKDIRFFKNGVVYKDKMYFLVYTDSKSKDNTSTSMMTSDRLLDCSLCCYDFKKNSISTYTLDEAFYNYQGVAMCAVNDKIYFKNYGDTKPGSELWDFENNMPLVEDESIYRENKLYSFDINKEEFSVVFDNDGSIYAGMDDKYIYMNCKKDGTNCLSGVISVFDYDFNFVKEIQLKDFSHTVYGITKVSNGYIVSDDEEAKLTMYDDEGNIIKEAAKFNHAIRKEYNDGYLVTKESLNEKIECFIKDSDIKWKKVK